MWGRRQSDHWPIYFVHAPELEGEQKAALPREVEQDRMGRATYENNNERAGIIGLVTDLDRDGPDIFHLFKGRQDVEVAFEAIKNQLDTDTTSFQANDAIRGYSLVTFLALRVYFNTLERHWERERTWTVSVEVVLYELSKIQSIV